MIICGARAFRTGLMATAALCGLASAAPAFAQGGGTEVGEIVVTGLNRRVLAGVPGTEPPAQALVLGPLDPDWNPEHRLHLPRQGDSPWVLVEAFSDRQPQLALAYHRETKRCTRLGNERPGIEPRVMGSSDFVRIRARDGLEIPA